MEVPENWIQSQTSPDFFLITCTCSSEVLRILHVPFFTCMVFCLTEQFLF